MSGKLVIISAPAGTGKTTIANKLAEHENIVRAVTATTRAPRGNEQDQVDYFFMSREEFEQGIQDNAFMEYATVFEQYYGVPRKAVEARLATGKHVLLVVDVQGGMTVRKNQPEALLIFLLPPNRMELEKRIRGRGEDDEESVQLRLRLAEQEMTFKDCYDYCVINDDLELATNTILDIILS